MQGTDSLDSQMADSAPLLKPLVDGSGDHEDRATDWLGRPVRGRTLGGWKSSIFILGSSSFIHIAYGGIFYNLVVYLTTVWNQSSAAAATNVTNLSGTMYFTALIGAFVGDAYLGRLWTAVIFQLIMFFGCFFLTLASMLKANIHRIHPPASVRTFMIFSLYLVALGNGSYQPPFTALGGDQFDDPRQLGRYFNTVLISNCIGQIFCSSVLTLIFDRGFWPLGFWICTAGMGLGVLLLLIGAPSARQLKAAGNPLRRVLQVLVAAVRKLRLEIPSDANLLYEVPGEQSAIAGSRKIVHSKNFRWLDKAALKVEKDDFVEGDGGSANPWRLCTVTQVEEVKCLGRILPILMTGILVSAAITQTNTFFIEQGQTMDRRLGSSFKIPAASMQLFSVLTTISFSIFYDVALAPPLRRITGHPKGITSLQRCGVGYALIIVAMIIAGFVERSRLEAAKSLRLISDPATSVPMSILWLIPQYALFGVSTSCAGVGSMDFFYSEVADGMRGLGSSLPSLVQALGNYLSSILVTVVSTTTTEGGKDAGWIPNNLNEGHLDYFYWLLAGLMAVTFLMYLSISHWYTYLKAVEDKDARMPATDEHS